MRFWIFVLSLVSMAGMLSASTFVFAQDEPEKIRIGDQEYTRGEIIADFLDIAISEHSITQAQKNFPKLARNSLPADYQWLAEFVDQPSGRPKAKAIKKWSDEITVGLNWPHSGPPSKEDRNSELYRVIKNQVNALAPELEKLTGQKVRFIEGAGLGDGGKTYARIRIVLSHDTTGGQGSFQGGPLYSYGAYLKGRVPFESSDSENMAGFILPDTENNVGMAICMIASEKMQLLLVKALVTECIVRSLGLPDYSPGKDAVSILRNWHSDLPKPYSIVSREAGGCTFSFTDSGPSKCRKVKSDILERVDVPEKAYSEILGDLVRKRLSPYDRQMISLLYCKDMKAGMTKEEAFDVLNVRRQCLK